MSEGGSRLSVVSGKNREKESHNYVYYIIPLLYYG